MVHAEGREHDSTSVVTTADTAITFTTDLKLQMNCRTRINFHVSRDRQSYITPSSVRSTPWALFMCTVTRRAPKHACEHSHNTMHKFEMLCLAIIMDMFGCSIIRGTGRVVSLFARVVGVLQSLVPPSEFELPSMPSDTKEHNEKDRTCTKRSQWPVCPLMTTPNR